MRNFYFLTLEISTEHSGNLTTQESFHKILQIVILLIFF